VLVVFDLLDLAGEDLRAPPLFSSGARDTSLLQLFC
jgi:hypothetical protein